ncbi:MAG: hypothetical protein ABL903_19090 [Methylococcales bacterium]
MKFSTSIGANNLFVHAGILMLTLVCALVAAQGELKFIVLVLGLIIAPLPILSPASKVLVWTLVLNFFIVGMVRYFGRFEQMHWVTELLFAALLIRLPFDMLAYEHRNRQQSLTFVFIFLLSFCVITLLSTAINQSPIQQAILGLKHYLFPLGLTTLIAYGSITPGLWLKIWRCIPLFMIIQLPIALYQYFFIAKYRAEQNFVEGLIAWDAIVGSFGGDPDGGGASGALGLFLCFGIVATIAMYRNKLISGLLTVIACLSAILVIMIGEVKAVIIFLPLGFLAYQRHKVFSSISTAILWLGGTLIFIPSVLLLYGSMHYSEAGHTVNSLNDIIALTLKTESDPEAYNRVTGELSRINALRIWWQENMTRGDYLNTIFGHGPAASEISQNFGPGAAAKNYPFIINTSSLAGILWDLGLLGAFAIIATLAATALSAFSTANIWAKTDPALNAIYEACGVGALLLIIDLPYDLSISMWSPVQSLMAIIFALVLTANQFFKPSHHTKYNPLLTPKSGVL